MVDSIQRAHQYYQDGATVVAARDFKRQRYIDTRTATDQDQDTAGECESTSGSGTRQRDKEQAERDEYADAAKTGAAQASGNTWNKQQRSARHALQA